MELNQEIKLKISPSQGEFLIKISFICISVITLLSSIFFSLTTFLNINSPKQPSASSQILNIAQITQAVQLISEKTINSSPTK